MMVRETQKYSMLLNDFTPITALYLSTRVYNALSRNGIISIGDLVFFLTNYSLLSLPHIGVRSEQEILEKLNNYLNSVRTSNKSEETINKDNVLSPKFLSDLEENIKERTSKYHILLNDHTSIQVLNLPIKIYRALKQHGIFSIKELVSLVEDDLSSVRNIGPKRAQKVLENLDYYLRDLEKSDITYPNNQVIDQSLEDAIPVDDVNKSIASIMIKERSWGVLHARSFGKTLREVAQVISVSRERVRQIEGYALRKFYKQIDLFFSYFDFLEIHADDLEITLEKNTTLAIAVRQIKNISRHYEGEDISSDTVKKIITLLRFYPKSKNVAEKERWSKIIFQTCSIYPHIKEHDGIAEEIEEIKEQNRDHTYKELAYEVLRREGRPRHWQFISEKAELLEKRSNFNVAGLYDVLVEKSEIFVRVEAGTYGLVEWGLDEVEYYTEIIANVLKENGKALSFGNIYQKVNSIRDIKKSSLQMYLDLNPRFYKSQANTFGLRAWLPPRHKQTLLTPKNLIEDQKSLTRVEAAIKRGYNVEEIIEKDK